MKSLHCPWREKYVTRDTNDKKCVFCHSIESHENEKNLIIFRNQEAIVCLNLFPYNAGHLLIIPNKHISELYDLPESTKDTLMKLTSKATKVLQKTMKCHGVNVGINIGKAAGAGIPDHIHIHVIPRWEGDTNFFPVVSDTKHISCDMKRIYELLKKEFKSIQ